MSVVSRWWATTKVRQQGVRGVTRSAVRPPDPDPVSLADVGEGALVAALQTEFASTAGHHWPRSNLSSAADVLLDIRVGHGHTTVIETNHRGTTSGTDNPYETRHRRTLEPVVKERRRNQRARAHQARPPTLAVKFRLLPSSGVSSPGTYSTLRVRYLPDTRSWHSFRHIRGVDAAGTAARVGEGAVLAGAVVTDGV